MPQEGKDERSSSAAEAIPNSVTPLPNRKSKIENRQSEEEDLPLLSVHQWLLALTVFAAIHATTWDLLWPNGIFILSLGNGLLWFGSSRFQLGSRPNGTALRRLPWAILLPALYFLILSLFYTSAARLSRLDVLLEASACGLALLTTIDLFAQTRNARPLFQALGIVGVLVCLEALFYIAVHLSSPAALRVLLPFANGLADNPNSLEARLSFPLRYWNAQATLLLVLSAITLGLQAAARTEREQWLWRAVFALHALCLILTGSRTGLLCFALLFLCFCLRHNRAGRAAALAIAGALTACLLGFLVLSLQTLLQISGSLRYRFRRWDYSLGLARAHPLTGGGWEFWFINRAKRFGVDGLYVWILASGGLPALAAAGLMMGAAAWEFRKFLHAPVSRPLKEQVFALALGLGATLAHGLMETVFIMPCMYLFFCLLIGLLMGLQHHPLQSNS